MQRLDPQQSPTLNDSVFSLRLHPTRLSITSNDTVTAVAAAGPLLWVGTQSGRLLRHNIQTSQTEEVRGRLGAARLDNAVAHIYADPHAHTALVILRNADSYLAPGRGLVRPRWLAKLRGLHCVSATWLRLSDAAGDRLVALIGTAFGALFSLTVDRKYERDDMLTLLWNAPHGDKLDGIRVEQVAGKFVASVATTSALYLFSDALSLSDLFIDDRLTIVNRTDASTTSSSSTSATAQSSTISPLLTHDDTTGTPLPSQLHFMTGSSGIASRRFVWASPSGLIHAQLAVRRRRTDRPPSMNKTTSAPVSATTTTTTSSRATRSTVIASIIDRDTIPWHTLEQASGSAIPLACNLTAFHVLVLYPGNIYAFNHISGRLTQRLALWTPTPSEDDSQHPLKTPSNASRTFLESPSASRTVRNESDDTPKSLSSPAVGFIRDVSSDSVWIYTADGQFARLVVSAEEQTEAWKAAKAMGRFELAMALAPLVSSDMAADAAVFQTREAVLEAQADHAAEEGDWDVAAQLYAKTNRPVESVILRIVDACLTNIKSANTQSVPSASSSASTLRSLGIGARLQTVKHMITYLVRKLDHIEPSKPMQRTIIATLLVQLYSSQLSSETDVKQRDDIRKDFGNFLSDRHHDLEIETALGILAKNGCTEEAWNLAVLSRNILTAAEMSSQRGQVEQTLSLLKNNAVANDSDMLTQLISRLCNDLTPQSPHRVMTSVARTLRRDSHYIHHMTVVMGLARVARDENDKHKAREAYNAATTYLIELLQSWPIGAQQSNTDDSHSSNPPSSQDDTRAQVGWCSLITFLFSLHADFGTETEAQHSYDKLITPHLTIPPSKSLESTLGVILRCATMANFRTLCVYVYQALGLYETAIKLAVKIDITLAEARVSHLAKTANTATHTPLPRPTLRKLWRAVARGSSDAVGVVERSGGILHIEDVLEDLGAFESASERVKNAVAQSLEEHRLAADAARKEAGRALEVTAGLREDVERARTWWRREGVGLRTRQEGRWYCCGHRIGGRERLGGEEGARRECGICGEKAVASVDAPFDSGHALPVGKKQ